MKYIKRMAAAALVLAAIVCLCAFSAAAIELKSAIGVVNTGGLRLRAKPDTASDILDNAGINDCVVIIRESGDFYLVDYNLQIGYMAKQYITYKEKENVELGYGRASESSVNLRAAPGADAQLLTSVPLGEKLWIIGFNCGWYKCEYDGLTGYVRSDLLELTEKPPLNSGSAAQTESIGQQIVDTAKQYLGVPYVWGGSSTSGFDCSGFTKYVFAQHGYTLNRTAAQQLSQGVSVTDLQVGDLVFFDRTYNTVSAATHVGIYVGNNEFIHAGGDSVKITPLSNDYYASRYIGAKRIF